MLKNTLKMPRADKKTVSIIEACSTALKVAEAITAFWGSNSPALAQEKFIQDRLKELCQQEEPAESDITAFLQMTTAVMGKSLKAAKKDMFAGQSLYFWQFAQVCATVTGVSSLYFDNEKLWKLYFVNGGAYRLRKVIKAWKAASTTEERDAAVQQVKEVMKDFQEANGSIKAPAASVMRQMAIDLLDNHLSNIFAMLKSSADRPKTITIVQEKADAAYLTKKADGAAVLSGLSQPADALIAEAKRDTASMLDPDNLDSMEWLNIRQMFGNRSEEVKAALINGRFGYGNPRRRDGCNNFINSGPSHGARWLKEFMTFPISKVTPVIDELRSKFENAPTISDSDATEWVNGIKISKLLMTEYDLFHGGDGSMLKDLKAVYKLAGGRLQTLRKIDLNRTRSYAELAAQSISLNPRGGKRVLWHEVGHHFEFSNPSYLKMALAYLTEKAEGDRSAIAHLTLFYEKTSFGKDEVAIVDSLSSPYVGKLYGLSNTQDIHNAIATEIFSSGFEYLANNRSGAISLINGDGLLEFVTGILKEVHG